MFKKNHCYERNKTTVSAGKMLFTNEYESLFFADVDMKNQKPTNVLLIKKKWLLL